AVDRLRYFEIQKGGKSSLEYHRHEHIVVCIRGRGFIKLDKKIYPLNHLDVVYISPKTIHQLKNPFDEPFGFLCIVKAKRDKPVLVRDG
ncbi:MAG: cupin domain-containing protein, partial [Thermodesulfovibrionales bacterium]